MAFTSSKVIEKMQETGENVDLIVYVEEEPKDLENGNQDFEFGVNNNSVTPILRIVSNSAMKRVRDMATKNTVLHIIRATFDAQKRLVIGENAQLMKIGDYEKDESNIKRISDDWSDIDRAFGRRKVGGRLTVPFYSINTARNSKCFFGAIENNDMRIRVRISHFSSDHTEWKVGDKVEIDGWMGKMGIRVADSSAIEKISNPRKWTKDSPMMREEGTPDFRVIARNFYAACCDSKKLGTFLFVQLDGEESTQVYRGATRNIPGGDLSKHAERLFITWFDDHPDEINFAVKSVEFYMNYTPCMHCSKALNEWLTKNEEISLKIYYAYAYVNKGDANLVSEYEEGLEKLIRDRNVDIISMIDINNFHSLIGECPFKKWPFPLSGQSKYWTNSKNNERLDSVILDSMKMRKKNPSDEMSLLEITNSSAESLPSSSR